MSDRGRKGSGTSQKISLADSKRPLDRVRRGFAVSDGRKPSPMAESRHSAARTSKSFASAVRFTGFGLATNATFDAS